jgi:hypothetical protein
MVNLPLLTVGTVGEEIVIMPSLSVVTVVAPAPLIVTESVPLPEPPAVKSMLTLPFPLFVGVDKS